jgi:TonB family protein
MSESWKRWEGHSVDGRFPLQSYLGGSNHSAVFLTVTPDSGKAAIKLIAADPASAEQQLLRWKSASEVTHPNVIRILAMGRCELDDTHLLYLVMEYGEENLAQIIPERALTAEEVRAMLPPILRAMQSVHEKRYVLGRIQPSNILAVGDQVKLASDSLSVASAKSRGGNALSAYDPPEAATGAVSAAGDVWQLGMTLIEVLTQHLPVWDHARMGAPEVPSTVPEPFRRIAGYCLQVDPGKRWTLAQIDNYLKTSQPGGEGAGPTAAPSVVLPVVPSGTGHSETPISGEQRPSAKWPYLLALAALVVAAIVWIARPKPSTAPSEQSVQMQPDSGTTNSALPAETKEKIASSGSNASRSDSAGVVKRVTPEVTPGARRTIHGKILVRVKVNVDAAGNVETAKIESGHGSKYFSGIALEAARDWKFSPATAGETGDREWKLQFAFSRTATEASVMSRKH